MTLADDGRKREAEIRQNPTIYYTMGVALAMGRGGQKLGHCGQLGSV